MTGRRLLLHVRKPGKSQEIHIICDNYGSGNFSYDSCIEWGVGGLLTALRIFGHGDLQLSSHR